MSIWWSCTGFDVHLVKLFWVWCPFGEAARVWCPFAKAAQGLMSICWSCAGIDVHFLKLPRVWCPFCEAALDLMSIWGSWAVFDEAALGLMSICWSWAGFVHLEIYLLWVISRWSNNTFFLSQSFVLSNIVFRPFVFRNNGRQYDLRRGDLWPLALSYSELVNNLTNEWIA